MIGRVERVFARCRTSANDAIEVEDIALAVLSFASGAVGVVECSTAVYPGFSERLEVTATGGTVIVEAGAMRGGEMKDEKVETSAYGAKAENAPAPSNAPPSPHLRHPPQPRGILETNGSRRAPGISRAA